MNTGKIVNEISRKLNGEFEAVDFESDDWNTIVSALNENIDFYNKSAEWRTSYDPNYSLGTVGDGAFYKLKRAEISAISGSNRAHVLFYDADNVLLDKYKLVGQDLFDQASPEDKVVTINSQGLQTKLKTVESAIYGATIVLPVFKNVKQVQTETDSVVTDDNYWLITKTAADLSSTSPVAFIARNYDDLNKQADKRMRDMKKNNRTTQASTPAYGGWNPLGGIVER